MWLFVVYNVLSASRDCPNVLAVHFSISILQPINLINLAFNANNAVPMHDIKIRLGVCILSAQ